MAKVLGFIAPRVTSPGVGMGAAERGWGVTKIIKSGSRSHLGADKVEKLSIISTTHKLETARIKRKSLELIDCKHKYALWGDEDAAFDLGLDKFGVDIEAINSTPTCPRQIFRCWFEDWELPLISNKSAVAKIRLLEKYKGLVFTDMDNDVTYTISTDTMYWKSYRGRGWCVIAEPPSYDGTNDDVLETCIINEQCLIYPISTKE